MAETKQKKIRIYKLASEYNLSAENLVEFLKSKGYKKVKTIQSLLTEEMITDIREHYKKDIEKAEKHYQKLAEFNKKRKEKSEEDTGDTVLKVEEEEEETTVPSEIKIVDITKEEEEEIKEEIPKEKKEEKPEKKEKEPVAKDKKKTGKEKPAKPIARHVLVTS